MSPGFTPASRRHQRAAASGSSHVENGTGVLPCFRREKRSSSAAATISPSTTIAAAGSWNTALTPSTTAMAPPAPDHRTLSLGCVLKRRSLPRGQRDLVAERPSAGERRLHADDDAPLLILAQDEV